MFDVTVRLRVYPFHSVWRRAHRFCEREDVRQVKGSLTATAASNSPVQSWQGTILPPHRSGPTTSPCWKRPAPL